MQAALHVAPAAAALGQWSECAGGGAVRYTREPGDERLALYPALIKAIDVVSR